VASVDFVCLTVAGAAPDFHRTSFLRLSPPDGFIVGEREENVKKKRFLKKGELENFILARVFSYHCF
jgi:hypothetical protein